MPKKVPSMTEAIEFVEVVGEIRMILKETTSEIQAPEIEATQEVLAHEEVWKEIEMNLMEVIEDQETKTALLVMIRRDR